MIRLTPSKNPDVILKFLQGEGIWKKCAGGMKFDKDKVPEAIKISKATFLIATDGMKGLGFVMLNPETTYACSIHLCLRTVGDLTKKIFALAINYAQFCMGCQEIHAVYPSSYRACVRLSKFFGFRPSDQIKIFYKTPKEVPYNFEILRIA